MASVSADPVDGPATRSHQELGGHEQQDGVRSKRQTRVSRPCTIAVCDRAIINTAVTPATTAGPPTVASTGPAVISAQADRAMCSSARMAIADSRAPTEDSAALWAMNLSIRSPIRPRGGS